MTQPTSKKANSVITVVYCILACYVAAQATWCGIAVIISMDLALGIIAGFLVSALPTVVCSAILVTAYQGVWLKFRLRWPAYLISVVLTTTTFCLLLLVLGFGPSEVLLFTADGDLLWMLLMYAPGLIGALAADLLHRRQFGAPTKPVEQSGLCPVCENKATTDAIRFGDKSVCLACKHIYVQQLKEGVART